MIAVCGAAMTNVSRTGGEMTALISLLLEVIRDLYICTLRLPEFELSCDQYRFSPVTSVFLFFSLRKTNDLTSI